MTAPAFESTAAPGASSDEPPARQAPTRTGPVTATDVLGLVRAGLVQPADAGRALQLAGCTPTGEGWRDALSRLFAVLAIVLIVSGAVCLVAWNWQALGRWGRFGLGQGVVAAVALGAIFAGVGRPLGQWLLIGAIALIGPLLALFGQTYQTGADLHALFISWALLALPWVIASRATAAWLLWLVIGEAALGLAVTTFDNWFTPWLRIAFLGLPGWMLIAAANALALIAWEYAGGRGRDAGLPEFAGRAGPRLLGAVLLTVLTVMSAFAIVEWKGTARWALPALAIAAFIGYRVYRRAPADLALLALGWTALTAVALTLLARVIFQLDGSPWFGLLLCAGLLVGSSVYGRNWLMEIAASDEEDEATARTTP